MSRAPAIGGQQKTYGSINSDVPSVGFEGLQFSPTELYNLCESITANIYTINSSWKTLESSFKNIGTERDNQGLRDRFHVTQLSCNQVIAQTTKELQRLTVVVKKGDKQQKLQVEKLTNEFKEAVQIYSSLQQKVAEKMKVCLLTQPKPRTTSDEEELLKEEEEQAAQKSMQRNLEFDNEMLEEREQRIREIEGDILDVNQIMRELGAMVHDQGDTINSIENNIENVHGNVELGQQQLTQAAQYQSKYRRKLCILIVIAVVIGIILTVILVTQLKR